MCLGHAYAGLGQPDRARPALDEARGLVDRWGFALHLWPDGPAQETVPTTIGDPPAGEQIGATV